MTPELQLLLGSIIGGAGALLSFWAGWRARGWARGGVIGRQPLILNEGRTTPKPDIISKPQFPQPRIIHEDFLP